MRKHRLAAALIAVGLLSSAFVAAPATIAPSSTVSEAEAHDCPRRSGISGTECHITPYNRGKWLSDGTQWSFHIMLHSSKYGYAYLPPGYRADPDANWKHVVIPQRHCIMFQQPYGYDRSPYSLCNRSFDYQWQVPFGDIIGTWNLWSNGILHPSEWAW